MALNCERQHRVGTAEEERKETKSQDGMGEAGSEVLPERRSRSGIIGREQQRQHQEKPANTRGTNQDAEGKRDSDCKFAVSDEKRNGHGVR